MQKSARSIAVVSVNKNKYSETFIHAQVKLLPFHVFYLHGGYLPTHFGDDDIPIFQKTGSATEESAEHRQAVKNFLSENKIELVLAQYGASGVKMMHICDELRIPLLVYFHGYDAYRNDMLATFQKDYGKLFDIAAAIFVVSHDMKEQLMQIGAPAQKINYNPCGANTELFTYHNAGKNPPVFFASGRFEASKSPHLTILAFHKALQIIPEIKLIYAGDGHLLEACKILVKALKMEHAVIFKSIIPHAQIAVLMSQSRAFLQHSVTTPSNDKEGTPVAIMEAAAAGLPVISTLHAGIPDVVEQEKTGFLVPEGDIDGMANYIMRLAQNPELATQMGKAGSEKINANFTLEKNIERLSHLINLLLK